MTKGCLWQDEMAGLDHRNERMRVRRLRVPMLALGVLNLLLAVLLFGTVPWSALTLPGYVLGASFLFGGIVSILGALAQKRGE